MNIHSYMRNSSVNGPGNRFVLWTQGCSKGCRECYNPETWSLEGQEILESEIFELIKRSNVDGVTISGGDPLEQPDSLLKLLLLLEGLDLPKGVIVFTGYTIDEIKEKGGSVYEILSHIDVLIDGRYEKDLKISSDLRGSANQNFLYFSSKIKEEELIFDHEIEVGYNGQLFITGFPKLDRKYLKNLGVIV